MVVDRPAQSAHSSSQRPSLYLQPLPHADQTGQEMSERLFVDVRPSPCQHCQQRGVFLQGRVLLPPQPCGDGTVLFHFWFGHSQHKSQAVRRSRCPICRTACGTTKGLRDHLEASHSRFDYTFHLQQPMPVVHVTCKPQLDLEHPAVTPSASIHRQQAKGLPFFWHRNKRGGGRGKQRRQQLLGWEEMPCIMRAREGQEGDDTSGGGAMDSGNGARDVTGVAEGAAAERSTKETANEVTFESTQKSKETANGATRRSGETRETTRVADGGAEGGETRAERTEARARGTGEAGGAGAAREERGTGGARVSVQGATGAGNSKGNVDAGRTGGKRAEEGTEEEGAEEEEKAEGKGKRKGKEKAEGKAEAVEEKKREEMSLEVAQRIAEEMRTEAKASRDRGQLRIGSERQRSSTLLQRTFYHSQRWQPITAQEMVEDADSEDEWDEAAASYADRKLLGEFEDVLGEEKGIMHRWMAFVRRHRRAHTLLDAVCAPAQDSQNSPFPALHSHVVNFVPSISLSSHFPSPSLTPPDSTPPPPSHSLFAPSHSLPL
ncbi:unnamed protein product [Closterium sp. Naga37s-1]|nr:unnamed protein product [Closterium sp. Naga37s-1]